ncbi:MAG: hypothetical protein JETT_2200 [Candidatus Jettenia ecosi]|uniref:Uncharacterized protein n=1 Tax=Candidatus Jettenia ecosi TaxID=2494326 RepID=A0A533QA26_9BACT|nr:MAG: hypothetical protein JETT_2200 [Candidatus Jettenia ecosi]
MNFCVILLFPGFLIPDSGKGIMNELVDKSRSDFPFSAPMHFTTKLHSSSCIKILTK